jgi:hypothetical protein
MSFYCRYCGAYNTDCGEIMRNVVIMTAFNLGRIKRAVENLDSGDLFKKEVKACLNGAIKSKTSVFPN